MQVDALALTGFCWRQALACAGPSPVFVVSSHFNGAVPVQCWTIQQLSMGATPPPRLYC